MPPPKFRGANFMRPKPPKIAEKDRLPLKKWKIFVGDKVQVMSGTKDVGKQGKVVEVLHDLNAVIVEGCKVAFKHVKPNPDHPKGAIIRKELHIPYNQVQLVDPATGNPTPTRLIKLVRDRDTAGSALYHPLTKRAVTTRLLPSNHTLPIPEPEDPFEKKKVGPLDTAAAVVERETFVIDINKCPFPNSFMNELERMRRKNRESAAC